MFGSFTQFFRDPTSLLYRLPAILIGLTVHEWAHAFAAWKLGDPTAKDMGRMTMNPLAHLDPVGLLSLILLGFGWAKPVPVNPRRYRKFRRDDIIVSLAGIMMNLLTAFAALLILYILLRFVPSLRINEAFLTIMGSVIGINLSLAVFNLIPLPPLDGSHVAENLFGHMIPRFFFFLRKYGNYILLALLLTGVLTPALSKTVQWLYNQ
ncbi:MAG: site-2 protease family protein, partial [Lachnospiraceae bacterium]|nr:site-2 protease family protein [Lachnospiraceae bacterium]